MPYSQNCTLVGINARDIGLNYACANKSNNLKFENNPSITKTVCSFRDYKQAFHAGFVAVATMLLHHTKVKFPLITLRKITLRK